MSKVTKIEQISIAPIPLPKPSIRKVAAYARVSTDRGEQLNSLEAQKDYYEKKIEEDPSWVFAGIYVDEGITGTSYHHRVEFLITLLTSLAQEEARSISENTAWGLRKRFADGKYSVGYKHFLGYNAGFEINEEQAVFDYTQTLITSRISLGAKKYSGITPTSSLLRCGICGAWYGPEPYSDSPK